MDMFKKIITSYLLLTGILFISQCSTAPDPSPPLQTRILQVKVEPNPVTMGDTATFTCIIADSLDERFRFEWGIAGDGSLKDTVTLKNQFKWEAPNEIKEYLHTVNVNNGTEPDSIPTSKSFTVNVIEENGMVN
jgi:hypothetical protein